MMVIYLLVCVGGYSKEDLADFVDQNFLPAGNDTEGWTPPDFNEDLPFAAVSFAQGINVFFC